jgi:ribulose-phosphate 3-epimerase
MTGFWDALPTQRLMVDSSLWSARLHSLKEDMARVESYVDLYHVDVTDAHFAPGLLFFPDLVAALRPFTQKPIHVHLMVESPLALIDDFAAAGANLITIHAENGDHIAPSFERMRALNVHAGLAIQLETPLEAVLPWLDQIILVTLMGTKLGIKGIDLDPSQIGRISTMRVLLNERGLSESIKIANDGGNRKHTIPSMRAAGVDAVVPGSLIFGSTDLDETFAWLHGLT